jgi:hypothetical protein
MANPKVKLVSIWISHGNLNMDIEMDAMYPISAYLKHMLDNSRIRRLNIRPFLPSCRELPLEQSPADPSRAAPPSAVAPEPKEPLP